MAITPAAYVAQHRPSPVAVPAIGYNNGVVKSKWLSRKPMAIFAIRHEVKANGGEHREQERIRHRHSEDRSIQ